MNCRSCNLFNRDKARFCKWCGARINIQSDHINKKDIDSVQFTGLSTLVDKDDIKDFLIDKINKAKSMALRCQQLGIKQRMELSFVITGDSGTGKTTIAKALTEEFFKAGIIAKDAPTIINPIKYTEFIKNLETNIKKLARFWMDLGRIM